MPAGQRLPSAGRLGQYERMTIRIRTELGIAQPFVAPATETEIAVAEIMSEFLKIDHVGRDDPFGELGVDSFSALQISLAVEERLGLALDTGWMTETATLRTIGERLER